MSHVADSTLLQDGLAAIQREIASAFDAMLPEPTDARARLAEAMRYAAMGGGKRIRPLLLAATAGLYGADRAQAVRCGVAIESVHVYSLIHDDLPCMDDDDLRHGKPTLHKAYDEATAVLAGDALQCFAFEVLSDPATSADPFTRADLVQALAGAAGAGGMVGGQMMDIVAETAMGAILAHVPIEGRTHLRRFARDIGLAFQIADDLLDHEGDEQAAGKALRKDAGAGKETFVSLLGAERARAQARMLVDQAVAQLDRHGQEADLLRALARYIVERDR